MAEPTEFELIGELTSDCSALSITHHKMLRRALAKYKGKELTIKIAPVKYKRSNSQNRYAWGILVPYIRYWLWETQGVNYPPDYVYTWMRVELLGEQPTIYKMAGKEVIIMSGKRMSQMSTREFAEAINTIIEKMAAKNCIIPLPKEKGNNFVHEFLIDE